MFAIATWWNGIGQPSTPLGMASVTPSQPMTATSRSRTHGRQLASIPANPSNCAPGPLRLLPRIASRGHQQDVACLHPHALVRLRRLQLRDRDVLHWLQPVRVAHRRNVEQHAAAHDAVRPRHDAVLLRAVRAHLVLAVAVVDLAFVKDVAERIQMRRCHPVGRDPDVVRRKREAALFAHLVPAADHVVLYGRHVLHRGRHRQRTRAAHRQSFLHERRRLRALRVRDQVERPPLVLIPPAPPVPQLHRHPREVVRGWCSRCFRHRRGPPRRAASMTRRRPR